MSNNSLNKKSAQKRVNELIDRKLRKTDDVETPKPRQSDKTMKKALRWIKQSGKWVANVVAGENKVGESVHGFLDLMPIPNQIIAKAASYLTKGNTREAVDELKKLTSLRNLVALAVFVLILTGVITIEDVRSILALLS